MDRDDDISLARHFRESAKRLRTIADRLHDEARENEKLAEVYEIAAKQDNVVRFRPRLVSPKI